MRHRDHVLENLREFEREFENVLQAPLTIIPAWDQGWTREEKARLTPVGWKNLTGVYFFGDACTKDDIHGSPADGRYTVIRRLGKATGSFRSRLKFYCHNEKAEPAEKYTYYEQTKGKGNWVRWFRYRWIDIIPIDKRLKDVTEELELLLLKRIRTECNDQSVPLSLKSQLPLIYDESPTDPQATRTDLMDVTGVGAMTPREPR